MLTSRIIGQFSGAQPGPLLIVLGGIHGNEPAGVNAIETVLQLLEREAILQPLPFTGAFMGLRGNLQALTLNKRYIEKDLNRQWTPENVDRIKATPIQQLHAEDLEMKGLLDTIESAIAAFHPTQLYLLDLHTTSADGGIFTIATDDEESIRIGVALHAPVIKGMLNGLAGTTMHYFTRALTGIPTVALAFESGQHDDPLSVNRAIAALLNCLQIIGCLPDKSIENRYDDLLRQYSEKLPKVAELVDYHRIFYGDGFNMSPGYHNFKPVKKNEVLAHDRKGPIAARADGLILMPLYQAQGSDGFFIVKPLVDVAMIDVTM